MQIVSCKYIFWSNSISFRYVSVLNSPSNICVTDLIYRFCMIYKRLVCISFCIALSDIFWSINIAFHFLVSLTYSHSVCPIFSLTLLQTIFVGIRISFLSIPLGQLSDSFKFFCIRLHNLVVFSRYITTVVYFISYGCNNFIIFDIPKSISAWNLIHVYRNTSF